MVPFFINRAANILTDNFLFIVENICILYELMYGMGSKGYTSILYNILTNSKNLKVGS